MSIFVFVDLYFHQFSSPSPCLMIYITFLIFNAIISLSILSIQHSFYQLILYNVPTIFFSIDELKGFNTFLYHQRRCCSAKMSIPDIIIISIVTFLIVYLYSISIQYIILAIYISITLSLTYLLIYPSFHHAETDDHIIHLPIM